MPGLSQTWREYGAWMGANTARKKVFNLKFHTPNLRVAVNSGISTDYFSL
jgi:hypothetical protein